MSWYTGTSGTSSTSYQGDSYSTDLTESYPPSLCSASRRMEIGDLAFIKFIGTGGSGKVYLAQDKVTEQYLAVKIMPKRGIYDNITDNILSERKIHAFLTLENDDHFLPLVACWQDDTYFYLASEYIAGGDLAMQLISQRQLNEDCARFYISELIIALEHLHARRIIHRDVKPSNILLRPDGHIILADFGISRRFDRHSSVQDACHSSFALETSKIYSSDSDTAYMTSDDCGTSYFMSPEQHRGDPYSFEADYWAVGVILYRMLTGEMPFGNDATGRREVVKSVLEDELTFPMPNDITPVARDFLCRLLAKDRCDRLRPCQVRNHPFFTGIDWKAVANRKLEAPCRPYVPAMPKTTRTDLPINEKLTCARATNSLLSFTWYNPTSQETCFPMKSFFDHHTRSRRSDMKLKFLRLKSWVRTGFQDRARR